MKQIKTSKILFDMLGLLGDGSLWQPLQDYFRPDQSTHHLTAILRWWFGLPAFEGARANSPAARVFNVMLAQLCNQMVSTHIAYIKQHVPADVFSKMTQYAALSSKDTTHIKQFKQDYVNPHAQNRTLNEKFAYALYDCETAVFDTTDMTLAWLAVSDILKRLYAFELINHYNYLNIALAHSNPFVVGIDWVRLHNVSKGVSCDHYCDEYLTIDPLTKQRQKDPYNPSDLALVMLDSQCEHCTAYSRLISAFNASKVLHSLTTQNTLPLTPLKRRSFVNSLYEPAFFELPECSAILSDVTGL